MAEDDVDIEGRVAAAEQLLQGGDYETAQVTIDAVLEQLNAAGGGEAEQIARALRVAATVGYGKGEHEQALTFTAQAAELWEAMDEHAHLELAMTLALRAQAQLELQRFDGVAELLERAADIFAQVEAREQLAAVLLTMAELGMVSEDYDAAAQLFARVLDEVAASEPTSEAHARSLNGLTAKSFFGLAGVHLRRGEHAQASDFLARSVEFFEVAHGRGHPELLEGLSGVAQLYRMLGDDAQAEVIDAELEAQTAVATPASDRGADREA